MPPFPSLTVLSSVHRNAALAAQALATCREIDPKVPVEIIVAVDSTTPPEGVGELQAVADRVIEFEFTGPNRFRPWLREQASGQWLLVLDSDEFPSERLVRRLPALLQDPATDGYLIPALNPFPTTNTYLVGQHWALEAHLRLVRNDGMVHFPGRKHTGTQHPGRKRRISEPFIHLHLLIDGPQVRKAKVRRYDGQAFGLMTHRGLPLNEAHYLPEAVEDLELASMASADAQRALSILAGLKAPGTTVSAPLPRVSGHEVDRWLDFTPIEPLDARGTITALQAPQAVAAGSEFPVEVLVTNTGDAVWHPFSPVGGNLHPTRLAYHWTSAGQTLVFDGQRTELPGRVPPGGQEHVTISVVAPDTAGPATLVVDVVQEGVRWFGIDGQLQMRIEPSAGQELLAAAQPLIPIREAIGQRRRLWHGNSLAQSLPQAAPSTSGDLPVGGWALDQVTLDYLRDLMRHKHLGRVLEFGSGTSTVLLGEVARELGGSLLSLEQDGDWVAQSQRVAARQGLVETVTVIHCPLGPAAACGLEVLGYQLHDEVREQIRALAPQLVIIDGPSQLSGGSRLGTVPSLIGLVPPGTVFAMDDALRDAELEVARLWESTDRIHVDGILPLGPGLLIGAIDPGTSSTPFVP